ncbi:hypothetical protein PHLGIDRAFT_20288 [Phlebiopsis gigantea 11061_1 CR5-6]|uniref:Uncharacterized protein n=1 Tax=Phlebiopsis gigantea (strain 11061_1 CR5-6) TaxID=745531 RepID=A0A0C3PDA3_PHLG1|nr:hypothetical protein PHLGIDRAFT_20288 [Phlebiopsis gigantea 11061_1 CR5-6]
MSQTQPEPQDSQLEPHAPLPLPPSQTEEAPKLSVGSEMKFDAFGPLVVNSDGTLSRIANWTEMTPPERERIMRVLVARNKLRLADQEAKLQQDGVAAPDRNLRANDSRAASLD